ncbi:hypothetical protein KEM56_004937, partial [Ascosphaera pollenicola]
SYQQSNSIVKGGAHPEKRCREGQAASAFLWFLWFVWMVSLFYSAAGMKGRFESHMSGTRPGRPTQQEPLPSPMYVNSSRVSNELET